MKLAIATAPKRDSRTWTQQEIDWRDIVGWLDDPKDHKESGNYLLGRLRNGTRSKATITERSALALDADTATADLPDLVELLVPGCAAVHTTYSSSPDQPKYRVLIPVDRPLLPDEYRHAVNKMMDLLGRQQFDKTCAEPERYMFRPAAKDRKFYDRYVFDGDPVSADWLLEDFAADLSDAELPRGIGQNKADPLGVPGIVGAFNRAYTIEEAIEAFDLPYDPAGQGRWTLRGSASVAGLNLISDNLVYSHHATDPAYGRASSAFDLVRVHRFGELDENANPDAPPHKKPSHDAMLQFAAADSKATREMAELEFGYEQSDDPDAPPRNWHTDLILSPSNGKMKDDIRNWDLIRDNDPVFQGLRYNVMSMEPESVVPLPWDPDSSYPRALSPNDLTALAHYVEREYRQPRAGIIREMLQTLLFKAPYHPIKEYLEGLEWDGVPRVETCLPGVTSTPYTRMVARKVLVAAVARVMEPGCKWDHVLVLYGKENLGKSLWMDKLSKGWTASLGDTSNKDTLLAMQRSWIMAADEGYSLRKGDADHLKQFLTRTHDELRRPYAPETERIPRHCVFWSTTNDETFLRSQEGNRRFLIVRCEKIADFSKMTDEYVDQLWAEALHLYRSGELLYLLPEESKLAETARLDFTEEEPLTGIIQQYLDTLVPENWDRMSTDARRAFLANVAEGMQKGERTIDRVCSIQIWTEALGNERGRHNRVDLLPITNALKKMPGWVAVPAQRLYPYGPQLVFHRTDGVL